MHLIMIVFVVLLLGIVAAAIAIRTRAQDPPLPRRPLTRPGAVWARLGPGDRVVLVALTVALLLVTTMGLYVITIAFS